MTQTYETSQTTAAIPTTTPSPDKRPRRKPRAEASAETPATKPTRGTTRATKTSTPADRSTPSEPRKPRRTADEKIADLLAQVERVREREAARATRANPAVKLAAVAARAINKAIAEAAAQGEEADLADAELVRALEAARGAIAGYLDSKGIRVPRPGKRRSAA